MIAADVFAYLARSRATLCAAVARVLAPGGLFAFTVETHDGEGAIVGAKLRYAHGGRIRPRGARGRRPGAACT